MSTRDQIRRKAKMKDFNWSKLTLLRLELLKVLASKLTQETKRWPGKSSLLSNHSKEELKLSSLILPYKLRFAV
jgi:hypothetical protein